MHYKLSEQDRVDVFFSKGNSTQVQYVSSTAMTEVGGSGSHGMPWQRAYMLKV